MSVETVDLMNRRYTDQDVREDERLVQIAMWYIKNYTGEFPYMVDLQRSLARGFNPNVSHVRGALNCLRNDPRSFARLPLTFDSAEIIEVDFVAAERRKKPEPPKFEINRERFTNTDTIVKGVYARGRSSGIFHTIRMSPFPARLDKYGNSYQGMGTVSWYLKSRELHSYGYGEPVLYVTIECSIGILKNPALYKELPDLRQTSDLLGIETKRCKNCPPSNLL